MCSISGVAAMQDGVYSRILWLPLETSRRANPNHRRPKGRPGHRAGHHRKKEKGHHRGESMSFCRPERELTLLTAELWQWELRSKKRPISLKETLIRTKSTFCRR